MNYLNKMKNQAISIAYFGSPDFSAHVLNRLISESEGQIKVSLVCTQPDKPVGRKKILTPTPVKQVARKHNIPCLDVIPQPEELKMYQIDIGIVYAYGLILPHMVLNSTIYGFWNIHPSLLPLYRGSSPVAYPLLLGDEMTGCTLIQMDNRLDHGPIIAQTTLSIQHDDNRESLTCKLSEQGFSLVRDMLTSLTVQSPEKVIQENTREQAHQKATYTKRFHKNDGFIDPDLLRCAIEGKQISKNKLPPLIQDYYDKYEQAYSNSITGLYNSAYVVHNMYRGLYKWPGIWTTCTISSIKKRLKILDLDLLNNKIIIKTSQLEGKTPTSYEQLASSLHFSL
jgi:methionyl-tRNA formyltransferase